MVPAVTAFPAVLGRFKFYRAGQDSIGKDRNAVARGCFANQMPGEMARG